MVCVARPVQLLSVRAVSYGDHGIAVSRWLGHESVLSANEDTGCYM